MKLNIDDRTKKIIAVILISLLFILMIPFYQQLVSAANSNFTITVIDDREQSVADDNIEPNIIAGYSKKKTHPVH